MPQHDLFKSIDRSQLSWTYSVDPTKPHDPAMFTCIVTGRRVLAVEYGMAFVPLNVVHEEVAALLGASWESYLFGEPDDVRQAIGRVHNSFKPESKARPKI